MTLKEKFYNSSKELSNIYSLAGLAMLLAIRVIVGIFANSTLALFGNTLKISLNFLPIAIAAALFGPGSVHVLESPTMGTEDFGYLVQRVPGAFYWIGVRNEAIGAVHPIHSPKFIADEAALQNKIALHTNLALRFLNGADA